MKKRLLRRTSKSRKIDIFPKWLTHGLGQKLPCFQLFFLSNIGQENVFYEIQEQKNAFLCYKKKKFKKSNNWHFFKGVNPWCLVYKCPFFRLLFFRQYRAGKCLLRYSGSKKRHCNLLKAKSLQSRKTDIFPRGLTHGFGLKMADFPTFFFRKYRPGKCLLRYSTSKETPL